MKVLTFIAACLILAACNTPSEGTDSDLYEEISKDNPSWEHERIEDRLFLPDSLYQAKWEN